LFLSFFPIILWQIHLIKQHHFSEYTDAVVAILRRAFHNLSCGAKLGTTFPVQRVCLCINRRVQYAVRTIRNIIGARTIKLVTIIVV